MTLDPKELLDPQQLEAMTTRLSELAVTFGMDILGGIIILIVGWLFSKWASRSVQKILNKTRKIDATLKPLIASIVRYVIMIMVVIAVLGQFGVETTSLIAVLGAAGLAVGLALQGTLSNIAAGVMLLILRPMRIGEYINAEGIEGSVEEIGLFTTRLKKFDGVFISVPNSQIWGKAITNFSRNPTRRLDITVGIGYGDSIDEALTIMKKFFKDKRILKDPAPEVMTLALGDSAVNVNLRVWTTPADYWQLKFDLTKDVKEAFDAADISIPFPQRDVNMIQMKPKKKKSKKK